MKLSTGESPVFSSSLQPLESSGVAWLNQIMQQPLLIWRVQRAAFTAGELDIEAS